MGIYVDLTGRPDLSPYAVDGLDPVPLEDPPDDLDLSTDEGRADLCAEDRVRARAVFRAEHGADPRTLTVLSTHEFHYVGGPRTMALVPDLVTAAVRAIVPVRPAPVGRRPSLRKRRKPPAAVPVAVAAPEPEPAPRSVATALGAAPVQAPPGEAVPGEAVPGEAAPGEAPPGEAPPGEAVPADAPPAVTARRAARATASVPVQRPTPVDVAAPAVDVAYYALADSADHPTGLLVVAMLPRGPQTLRWEAPGSRTAGSPIPVSRQRAEEISREALGFELPAEPRLPELPNG